MEITYRYDFVLRRAPPPAAPTEAPVVLGRVIERGTRAPVAGASLDVGGVAAETDADGRFEVRGVAPGPAKVHIVAPGTSRSPWTRRSRRGSGGRSSTASRGGATIRTSPWCAASGRVAR